MPSLGYKGGANLIRKRYGKQIPKCFQIRCRPLLEKVCSTVLFPEHSGWVRLPPFHFFSISNDRFSKTKRSICIVSVGKTTDQKIESEGRKCKNQRDTNDHFHKNPPRHFHGFSVPFWTQVSFRTILKLKKVRDLDVREDIVFKLYGC